MIALGTLGMMLATAPIPGVDVVTDSVGAGAEIAEAGVAADDAIQLSRFMKLLKTVEDVVQDVTKVVKIYLPLIQFLAKAGAIATIATVTLLVLASIPSDSSLPNQNPPPSIYYPPGIAGDPQKEALYRLYFLKYGDVNFALFLVYSGLTPDQVEELIQRYGLRNLLLFAHFMSSRGQFPEQNGSYFAYLYNIRNIPGSTDLLTLLLENRNNPPKFQGLLYEL